MTKTSLSEGAAKMTRIVRAARERQHSRSGFDEAPLTAMNPSDAWARKYLSEAIGPEAPRFAAFVMPERLSVSRQAEFMRELKVKASEGQSRVTPAGWTALAAPGKITMERPFAPTSAKRSAWGRLLHGK